MPSTRDLLILAESWARAADSTLFFWPIGQSSGVPLLQYSPAHAGQMACALALRDALRSELDFWQTLRDLGLEPFDQDGKRPGG